MRDRSLYFVRANKDGQIVSIGRTTMAGLVGIREAFPNQVVHEITSDQHKELKGRRNIWLVDGIPVLDAPPGFGPRKGDNIEQARRAAYYAIDQAAAVRRKAVFPTDPGIMLERIFLLDEAIAYQRGEGEGEGEDASQSFPMLVCEKELQEYQGINKSLGLLAAEIVAEEMRLRSALAAIRRVRLRARLRVELAGNAEDIRAIMEGLIWPELKT